MGKRNEPTRFEKQDKVAVYYEFTRGMTWDAGRQAAQKLSEEALEAEYQKSLEWDHEGYGHQIDPAVFDRLEVLNESIGVLEKHRDAEMEVYRKAHNLSWEHMKTAIAAERSRRFHKEWAEKHPELVIPSPG